MDDYIFHTILSVTMCLFLLIIIAIKCYNIKPQLKQKNIYCHIYNIKMTKNNVLKETDIKNCTFYYFDDIKDIKDLDLDNILLNKKSNEIFLNL